MEVVQFVPQLGKALWNLKGMYDQHVENGNEIKELQSFIQDYDQQIPILRERFQEGGGNVIGIVAFKNLEKDVMEATNKLERWSRNKSFFQVFNCAERMLKLRKLHSKVMASVQNSLGIANLSMLLDLQAIQSTILESNAELKSLLITSIGSTQGMLQAKVRDVVVEASTSSFGDAKFWEDIVAVVDNHNAGVSLLEDKNMYEDPITTNLMIDPIVASNGNTYCRWTIIDNNLTTNPFNVDEDLTIVIDNLTFRRGLFEKFPEQVEIFRRRRYDYRSHAFSLKEKGLWGDALLALHYVLQWDKHDVECIEGLQQVQGALEEAKEKYLQTTMGLSNELPIISSMHEMVVETCIDLDEAYKLFPTLLSSKPEFRQRAALGICQWSKRDVKFQRYIVKKGGIPLLAALLPSSDPITQEHLVSILLDISQSLLKYRTIFGTLKYDFRDALEPIAEILREGSTKAREQVARIFFNLSTSPNRKSIIANFKAMHALVTSFANGTLQFKQIGIDIIDNLFPDVLKPIAKILKEGPLLDREGAAKILFNLSMNPERRSVIEKSMAMHNLVTLFGNGTIPFQQIVTDIVNNLFPDVLKPIAKILKEGSFLDREGAAKILFNLSMNPERRSVIEKSMAMHNLVTLFGNGTIPFQQIVTDIVNNLFPDVLKPIAKILKEGSFLDREGAAKILFNLSMNPERRSVIGKSMAMHNLVTLFGNGTIPFQQIVTDIVNNLFPDVLKPIAKILKEGSFLDREGAAKILFNLSMNPERRSVIGKSMAMHNLVTLFGNGIVSFQEIVIDIVNNLFPDALEPIAKILKEGSLLDREGAAKILFNLSMNPDRRSVIGKSMAMHNLVTFFGNGTVSFQEIVTDIVNNLFLDALEPITKVLKEGSLLDREGAAKILFNLSMNPDRRSVIGKSMAMHNLVTLFGNGTVSFQEIVTDIVNNLFPDVLKPIAKILKEGSFLDREGAAKILFNLSMNPERRSVIEKSMAMHNLVTLFGNGTIPFQQIVTDIVNNLFPDVLKPIAKILKEGSFLDREGAAKILFNLSMNPERRSVIGKSMAMHNLVTLFGNGTVSFQQIVTDIVNNLFPDVLKPIAKILKEGSLLDREGAAKILFNLSMNPNRRSVIGKSMAMHNLVTLFGNGIVSFQEIVIDIVNNLFPDALEPIAKILKEGSLLDREGAAKILFNLSMNPDRRSVIGKSMAMYNLVTLFGNGTVSFQKIVTNIVNNLFPDVLKPIAKVLKEGSLLDREGAAKIFFNLSMKPNRRNVIGKSMAMHNLVTLFGNGTVSFQEIVIDIVNNLFPDALEPIVKILKEGSLLDREGAAKILFNLSMNPERRSVIGKSMATHALMISLRDGTPQFQEMAIGLINKFT